MTLKEILSVMCVDSMVSVWGEPDGMNLLEQGTVLELLYGNEETLPRLTEEQLAKEVLVVDPFRSTLSRDGVQTAIHI